MKILYFFGFYGRQFLRQQPIAWLAFLFSLGLALISGDAPAGNWYAHSYGGVAFTEAIRVLAKKNVVPAGEHVTYLAGANNRLVTNAIMKNSGVTVKGYYQSWWDAVPNLVGANSYNPIQWIANLAASWTLFMGPEWSPHTYPPVR